MQFDRGRTGNFRNDVRSLEGEITLAETLVDLGDQGYKERLFHSENKAPSIAITNRKIDKIVGLISKLQKALDDESASGLEAKKVLASCLVQTATPEHSTSPLESGNWIYQAKHVAERLSAIDPKIDRRINAIPPLACISKRI